MCNSNSRRFYTGCNNLRGVSMNNNRDMIAFLYGHAIGRLILKLIMVLHLDRIVVWFLWTPLSLPFARWYVKKNHIKCDEEYSSYREMFVRTRKKVLIDDEESHLISPCDSWMSYFLIDEKSCFSIKNSTYMVKDFIQEESIASKYINGHCLVFRLCPSDYHHYCYVDDGYQGELHYIPGVLHSVQPIACEQFPVYVLNKRCWSTLESNNFGTVVQCEIGALIVGDIINEHGCRSVKKGEEKGYFELAGSTIVLLFQENTIKLRRSLVEELENNEEVKVMQGEWIATAQKSRVE